MTTLQTAFDTEQAWRQVEAHDASADGRFVYAVRSTGIFCRPGCPSRRPAQHKVIFYPTPAEASAAGYRPCKRCRPQAMHPQAAVIDTACRYLRRHLDKAPTLAETARVAGMNPFALQRLFRKILGVSPRQYHAGQRRNRLRQELSNGASGNVTDAIYAAGYGSSSRVYEHTAETIGMTPAQYRGHGTGQRLRFCVGNSILGNVLIAATERGICAVTLGDSAAELEAALRREFANAQIEEDAAGLAEALAALLAQLTEHPVSAALPLDVRATAFQWRVWQALRKIPRGETRSYGQIAAGLGQPTAVRAVARACSQNPVALLVPCHRVVGKDGKLTGYRWGIERKRQLLDLEQRSER